MADGYPPVIPKTKSPYSLKELLSALLRQDNNDEVRFEREFSEFFGFPHGLFFNYGRSGLYALLKVLGFRGEEVLLPAYTCVVVANAIVLSGNRVRFMDNEPDHFNVSANTLSSSINNTIKMIIPTPLLGYRLDHREYEVVISQKAPDAFLLYDNAQGFCPDDHDDAPLSGADGALFGLGEGKIISSLYGGMLLLRDRSLYKALKRYRDRSFQSPGVMRKMGRLIYGFGYWSAYVPPVARFFEYLKNNTGILDSLKNDRSSPSLPGDFKERPTGLQAKLGRMQLARFVEIIAERRTISRHYEKGFTENGLSVFSSDGKRITPYFPCLTGNRDLAITALREFGMAADYPFYRACPDLPGYETHRGSFPNSRSIAERLITLPVWPGMTASQVDYVTRAVIHCKGKHPDIFPY